MADAAPAHTIRIPRVESTPLEISNNLPLTFICGPCQLESREHALETAEFLRDVFKRVIHGARISIPAGIVVVLAALLTRFQK